MRDVLTILLSIFLIVGGVVLLWMDLRGGWRDR